METLCKKLRENRSAILSDLDVSKELLALLSRKEVLDITECVRLQVSIWTCSSSEYITREIKS